MSISESSEQSKKRKERGGPIVADKLRNMAADGATEGQPRAKLSFPSYDATYPK